VASFFFTRSYINKKSANIPAIQDASLFNCTFEVTRLSGYEYVKPLLFAEEKCQTPRFSNIREQLQQIINNYIQPGTIQNASVYLRELNTGEWLSIGENEKYLPGSLMKVPELITFMKMNEKDPGLLNKSILYDSRMVVPKNAVFTTKTIEPGKSYTIKELLYNMIAYSDNISTMLLNSVMDLSIFKKTFTDLGIHEPDLTKKDIPLTAREFSRFMRTIYNASYLSSKDSEFCAELLSKSDFTTGLLQGLPKNSKVLHKFGEAGDKDFAHFSESGIIYTKNKTYLLTVMTKGKKLKSLPPIVGEISNRAYGMIEQL
jgi:beta-lactamase class A